MTIRKYVIMLGGLLVSGAARSGAHAREVSSSTQPGNSKSGSGEEMKDKLIIRLGLFRYTAHLRSSMH
jgi:hypothetical protein